MDFEENKRVIILTAVALVLVFVFLLKDNNPPLEKTHKTSNVKTEKKSKDIEVLYVDEDANKEVVPKETKRVLAPPTKKAKKPKVVDITNLDEEGIKAYLKEKSLKNITTPKKKQTDENYEAPRFSVYSNIDKSDAEKLRDETRPPSTPVIVQGSFGSGTPYTVAIDADIYSQAKDIVISNNDPDGTIEEITNIKKKSANNGYNDEKQIIAPPSIGATK